MDPVSPMQAFLDNISLIVTEIFDWIGQVTTEIVDTPFLLLTVGFLCLGGAIALVGRLLSRR